MVVSMFPVFLGMALLLGCPHGYSFFLAPLQPSVFKTLRPSKSEQSHRYSPIDTSRRSSKEDFSFDDTSMDYLITDSLDLSDEDRPTVQDFMFGEFPREGFVRLPFLLCGAALSLCNILALYQENVYAPLVTSCCVLGMLNAILDVMETKGITAKNIRRGSIDPKVLTIYAGTYSASVCWLALRVYPPACPTWLPNLDPIMGAVTSTLFLASLIAPLLTVLSDNAPKDSVLEKTQIGLVRLCRGDKTIQELPPFTSIERYRAYGLLVIGFVACLYLPVASYLAIFGDQWWTTSLERYPQQGLLETSTALFGLLAAQSNISITRAAGYGVRPVSECVQIGAGICLVLTVVPCASALYFLQSGTTFFDHYQYVPSP